MKLAHADARKWVMNLRDGFLQMQRVFQFENAREAAAFWKRIEDQELVSNLRMTVKTMLASPDAICVILDCLPDQELFNGGCQVAAACEYEYLKVQEIVSEAA